VAISSKARQRINDMLAGIKQKTTPPPQAAKKPGVPQVPVVMLKSKFGGYCKNCQRKINKDDPMGWNPAVKGEIYCETCANQMPTAPKPQPNPVVGTVTGGGGASTVNVNVGNPYVTPPSPTGRRPPPPPPLHNFHRPTPPAWWTGLPKRNIIGPYDPWYQKADGMWYDESNWPVVLSDEAVEHKTDRVHGAVYRFGLVWYDHNLNVVTLTPPAPPPPPKPTLIISHIATTADLKALVALEEAVIEKATKNLTPELRKGFDLYNKLKTRAVHPGTPEPEARTALKLAIIELVRLVY
jgi:hypothetical protein